VNDVEKVRYVHSDRSWIAALLGGLVGAMLGATLMGVAVLMWWTMRLAPSPAAHVVQTSPPAVVDARGTDAATTISRDRSVSSPPAVAQETPASTETTAPPQRATSQFSTSPKGGAPPADREAEETVADSDIDDSTGPMPEHGPMSKATIEAYSLPGAEPE
jgi:hypothetical protein